ncbi:MAG: chemotaxis protein CheC [Defluviitaleaceae bacterium]|nr:chemotaxis protein CheC [Defluviitaleaceae bacterium]
MGIGNMNSLNNWHYEVLKEIGNIGVGHAIGALEKLINKRVRMTVPEVKLLAFKDVGSILGGDEVVIFGILVGISGDINGIMMFLIKPHAARILVNGLMGTNEKGEEFSEMCRSALEEIGNILCSSYLMALSALINKSVIPAPPTLAMDMATAILSVPAIEFGKMADGVLFIDTMFETDGENSSGYFLLVPDFESFGVILTALGVM